MDIVDKGTNPGWHNEPWSDFHRKYRDIGLPESEMIELYKWTPSRHNLESQGVSAFDISNKFLEQIKRFEELFEFITLERPSNRFGNSRDAAYEDYCYDCESGYYYDDGQYYNDAEECTLCGSQLHWEEECPLNNQ